MDVKIVIIANLQLGYFMFFVLCILSFNFKTTIQRARTTTRRMESV